MWWFGDSGFFLFFLVLCMLYTCSFMCLSVFLSSSAILFCAHEISKCKLILHVPCCCTCSMHYVLFCKKKKRKHVYSILYVC